MHQPQQILLKFTLAFTFFSLMIFSPLTAHSLPIETTFHASQIPKAEILARWSAAPKLRSYFFELGDPRSWDLNSIINHLSRFKQLRFSINQYPGEDTLPQWIALGKKGAQLIVREKGLPTSNEILRLNRTGLAYLMIVLNNLPPPSQANKLSDLAIPASVLFNTGHYPLFRDKPLYLAFPRQIQLEFKNDFWPWYSHMDAMNLLPHTKTFIVKDVFPSKTGLQYLHNIHSLKEVTLDSDMDVRNAELWSRFGSLRVNWLVRDFVPSEQALAAFGSTAKESNTRYIQLSLERAPTASEKIRIEATSFPVEWIYRNASIE